MHKLILLTSLFLFLAATSCGGVKPEKKNDLHLPVYKKELNQLREYFHIPGLAVLIKKEGKTIYEDYLGYADQAGQIKVDSSTLFPVASLTKMLSSVLILQEVKKKNLSLEVSMKEFFPQATLDTAIRVKHVLSHTSEGEIGKQFHYSQRYGYLTGVLEQRTEKPFASLMEEQILGPLGMKQSFLLKDSAQVAKLPLAKPYLYDGEIIDGELEYGFSSSAGLVSNVRDLAKFDQALDNRTLLSDPLQKQMLEPFQPGLAYGYGIFSQEFMGKKLVWAYGQYDFYSSLFLKVPEEKLTLILTANNNLMSDPARLIYGDVTSSLFALSFLKNFVFDQPDLPLMASEEIALLEENNELNRQLMLARALAASFMARFGEEYRQTSIRILDRFFELYPDYADLNLMHTLAFLKDVAFYMELEPFTRFDEHLERTGKALLTKYPSNPYVNIYMATYYDRKGERESAKEYFLRIIKAKNYERFWYTVEAEGRLKEME